MKYHLPCQPAPGTKFLDSHNGLSSGNLNWGSLVSREKECECQKTEKIMKKDEIIEIVMVVLGIVLTFGLMGVILFSSDV
jgi:hypothetical protein